MQLDIVLSLNTIADAACSKAPPTFGPYELENMTDSDSESDPGLEIGDIHIVSGEIDDKHNDSDREDVSNPRVRSRPSGQETIPGAGRPLGKVAGYTELNKAMTNDPGALSHPKTSLIWRAGLTRARYTSRRSTRRLPKVWAVLIADYCAPPIPCDNTSTYWTHFVNSSCGWKPVLMMVDMQQRSIIEILVTVSAT